MKILLFFLIFNIVNVFKTWENNGGDLRELITDYVKSTPPQSEDYVVGTFIIDMLSNVDSSEVENVYKALYKNFVGECYFTSDLPEEIGFLAVKCYINRGYAGEAERLIKKIHNDNLKCMSSYFLGKYYYEHNKKDVGKDYLQECIIKCKGVVAIWSRNTLFER